MLQIFTAKIVYFTAAFQLGGPPRCGGGSEWQAHACGHSSIYVSGRHMHPLLTQMELRASAEGASSGRHLSRGLEWRAFVLAHEAPHMWVEAAHARSLIHAKFCSLMCEVLWIPLFTQVDFHACPPLAQVEFHTSTLAHLSHGPVLNRPQSGSGPQPGGWGPLFSSVLQVVLKITLIQATGIQYYCIYNTVWNYLNI